MSNLLNRLKLDQKPRKTLYLFLLTDLFFIVLHITYKIARRFDIGTTIRDDQFSIYYDLTLAESFQYIKEYWIVLVFVWLIFRKKNYQYLGWALLFTYLLFDDMLSFHEGLATIFLERLNLDPFHILYGDLRYQDFGELSVSLFFGALFLPLIAYFYIRSGREVRTTFHYLIGGLSLIVFFGVVNDTLNRVFDEESNKIMYEITRLIEDGGEMIAMSLTGWYVLTLIEPTADTTTE